MRQELCESPALPGKAIASRRWLVISAPTLRRQHRRLNRFVGHRAPSLTKAGAPGWGSADIKCTVRMSGLGLSAMMLKASKRGKPRQPSITIADGPVFHDLHIDKLASRNLLSCGYFQTSPTGSLRMTSCSRTRLGPRRRAPECIHAQHRANQHTVSHSLTCRRKCSVLLADHPCTRLQPASDMAVKLMPGNMHPRRTQEGFPRLDGSGAPSFGGARSLGGSPRRRQWQTYLALAQPET
jgi:hypothetical protein